MRIIGGKYRGKKLISPVSDKVRPTSDRAREALFNILRSRLGADFRQLKLLDLFAGSGAFALEAISQGFAKVTMIDIDTSNLLKNVNLFALEKDKISVIKADLTKTFVVDDKYDVLFMDAPYQQGFTEKALASCCLCLNSGALCLIELRKDEILNLPSKYRYIDEKRYGMAKVIIAEFI